MTVSEMLRVMYENDLFDTFPTCDIVFHRFIIQSVAGAD